MYKTPLVHKVLAAAAGCTFSLAIGVSVGAVPGPGDEAKLPAASAPALAIRPSATGQALIAAHIVAPTTATTLAAPSPTVASTTAPRVTTPPTTRPRPTTTAPAAALPASAAPTPVALVAAARRTPSSAEVEAAISSLVQQVGGLLRLVRPTPAQIAKAGDQVCTGFDTGQSFAQVKSTGLSMVPSSVTVSPATADWAVRTAVSMYCPDHASKLV